MQCITHVRVWSVSLSYVQSILVFVHEGIICSN